MILQSDASTTYTLCIADGLVPFNYAAGGRWCPRRTITREEMGYCINCDNRHGCKSGVPPCIGEMTKNGVTGTPGKRYLIEARRIERCRDCPFFRSCWNSEEYEKLLRSSGR